MSYKIKLLILIINILITPIICQQCRILSLSGAGAHGSFEAGLLKKLIDNNHNWDIITGVSAGSLNTILLGLYNETEQETAIHTLTNIWMHITNKDVYKRNYDPFWDKSLYDNSPLNNTIYNIINKYNGLKRKIIISATNLNNGEKHVFSNNKMLSNHDILNIIMGSASIPIYFPPRYMFGNYYIDGGVFSNELIDNAVFHCIEKYKNPNISIDVILASTPITNITNKEIEKYGLYGMFLRTFELLSNSLFNHELYTYCNNSNKKKYNLGYPMNIYTPSQPVKCGLLDFEHQCIYDNYINGYNSDTPTVTKYCF